MPMFDPPTNETRADWAESALDHYSEEKYGDAEPAADRLKDLLTDSRHLCDRYGLDFDGLVGGSVSHHHAEIHGDEYDDGDPPAEFRLDPSAEPCGECGEQIPDTAMVDPLHDSSCSLHPDAQVAAEDPPRTILSITFTTADIEDMADPHDVPPELAVQRAEHWAKAITDTAVALIDDQLSDAVYLDQA